MDDDWGYPYFRKPPYNIGGKPQILSISIAARVVSTAAYKDGRVYIAVSRKYRVPHGTP